MKQRENTGSRAISDLRETVPHGDLLFHMSVHEETILPEEDVILYPHWHDELEILYLREGTAEFCVDGKTFFLKPGQAAVIQPDLLHSAGNPLGHRIAFTAVLMHADFLSSLLQDSVQQKYISPLFGKEILLPFLWEETTGELVRRLQEVARFYREKPSGYELLLKSELFRVLYLLWKEIPGKSRRDPGKGRKAEQMKAALQFMQREYDRRLTVRELADRFHMSEGHFSRMFRETCRIPPMEYLISCRVAQAARLLRETDRKLTEIALETGFNSVNYFTGAFHKRMGCSPREYRKSMRLPFLEEISE